MISPDLWRDVREEARSAIRPPLEMKILGSDIDAQAIEYAQFHARKAGVADDILFEQKDFRDLADDRKYGCIICNPPYGDRIGEHEQYRPLYASMPGILANLPTWSFYIYTSWNDFEDLIGQKAVRRRKLFNSRIECTYFQFPGPKPPRFRDESGESDQRTESASEEESASPKDVQKEIPADPLPIAPVFTGLDDYSKYQIEEFGKCLKNRIHHLRRYPKRGITCYRLYDRDFPEVPLAIDLFEGEYLHLAEYERPDERSVAAHRLWLDKITERAGEILEIAPENIFLKRRTRQRGESQYEKLGQTGRIITAKEGGLLFQCNMSDYLDVGLFLDHRLTRDMVRKESKGKRFLNLFSYTGSFSCYAADGGAASTVSVDLSPNYLDWARANMEMNGFYDRDNPYHAEHKYIKADTMRFLQSIPERGKRGIDRSFGLDRSDFDLCVCDPPTFSNSKSTMSDWDVQRSHVDLLRLLATRMVPGGVLYFSNNFRRFKLDEERLSDLYQIREISARTVPEEYRNKRIHRCWRMIVQH
ncbi:MAG: class I SAM-dependent methyltransferase [Planctomycetia bacterium]|nr:class I SAM-dependent methyltransferase [Planctomycetia bacterium]